MTDLNFNHGLDATREDKWITIDVDESELDGSKISGSGGGHTEEEIEDFIGEDFGPGLTYDDVTPEFLLDESYAATWTSTQTFQGSPPIEASGGNVRIIGDNGLYIEGTSAAMSITQNVTNGSATRTRVFENAGTHDIAEIYDPSASPVEYRLREEGSQNHLLEILTDGSIRAPTGPFEALSNAAGFRTTGDQFPHLDLIDTGTLPADVVHIRNDNFDSGDEYRLNLNGSNTDPILDFVFRDESANNNVKAFSIHGLSGNVEFEAGNLLLADGTTTNPGLSFANDTDTGIIRKAEDTLDILTGGSGVARFNAAQWLNMLGNPITQVGGTTDATSGAIRLGSGTQQIFARDATSAADYGISFEENAGSPRINMSSADKMTIPTVSSDPSASVGDMWYRTDLD